MYFSCNHYLIQVSVTRASEVVAASQSISARVGRQRTTTTSSSSSSSSSPSTPSASPVSPTIDVFFFVEGALNGCVSLYAHLPSVNPITSSSTSTTTTTATTTPSTTTSTTLQQQLTALALTHTPIPLLTGLSTLSRPTAVSIVSSQPRRYTLFNGDRTTHL